jgi:hypothetical protein
MKHILTLLLPLCLSCGDKPEDTAKALQTCSETGETIVGIISTLTHARRENGVGWGLNIDGLTSINTDPNGCYKDDLVDPYGNPGIDNAFSALIPALESTEAVALETLVQQSIHNGNLLLMVELKGVNDWQNDDCVDVSIWRGQGTPLLGTDGVLMTHQSFFKDHDMPNSHIQGMKIVDGILVASPLDVELPVQVLDEKLNFEMENGGIHIELTEDGFMSGFFTGALPITALTDITSLPDVNLPEVVQDLVRSAADLYPQDDGSCSGISVAFEYTALPAFFTLEDTLPKLEDTGLETTEMNE